jgi:hypothetical protein
LVLLTATRRERFLLDVLYIANPVQVFSAEHKKEALRYLENHQNADGGFGLHIEGGSTMFGTGLKCGKKAAAAHLHDAPSLRLFQPCSLAPDGPCHTVLVRLAPQLCHGPAVGSGGG